MNWFAAIVVFILIWWMVFFMVLPWGVRGQFETGEVTQGTEPGAPVAARMQRKLMLTSAIAVALFIVVYAVVSLELITLDDIPFGPRFEDAP